MFRDVTNLPYFLGSPFLGAASASFGNSSFGKPSSMPTPFSTPSTPPENHFSSNVQFSFGKTPSMTPYNSFGNTSNTASSSTSPWSQQSSKISAEEARRIATDIYEKYNPSKVADIPSLLLKYEGKEGDLIAQLQKKYLSAQPNLSSMIKTAGNMEQPTFGQSSIFSPSFSAHSFGSSSATFPTFGASTSVSSLSFNTMLKDYEDNEA
jgi:hypothetical protein